jgi:hypothetical protein
MFADKFKLVYNLEKVTNALRDRLLTFLIILVTMVINDGNQ